MKPFQKISAKVRAAIRKIRGSKDAHPNVQKMTDAQLAERLVGLDSPVPTVTAPRVTPTHPPRVQPPRIITDESPDRYPESEPLPEPEAAQEQASKPDRPHYHPPAKGATDRRFQP